MSIGTLDQLMADMKKGVYDYTQDGHCSSCGQCCSNTLPMSKKEAVRIREYVQRKHIKECVNRPPTMEPVKDWTCPFRDNVKRICTIYEVRPAICRDLQCDKPRKDIEANKKMYHGKYAVVFMRETFFPKEGEDDEKRQQDDGGTV
jgi:hypothetical protein